MNLVPSASPPEKDPRRGRQPCVEVGSRGGHRFKASAKLEKCANASLLSCTTVIVLALAPMITTLYDVLLGVQQWQEMSRVICCDARAVDGARNARAGDLRVSARSMNTLLNNLHNNHYNHIRSLLLPTVCTPDLLETMLPPLYLCSIPQRTRTKDTN